MQLSDSILLEFHMDTAGPRVSGSLAVELLRIDPREAAAAVSISWRMASTSGCLPVTSASAAVLATWDISSLSSWSLAR